MEITGSLAEGEQRIAGSALQSVLVDLVDLSLVAKQAHWNLVGPRFRSVHLQLDEVVTAARDFADTVAERAAAIGVPPDGRAATVAADSVIAEHPVGWISDTDVVAWFVDQLGAVIGRVREQVEETEKADPITQDLFIGIAAELEKHRWMFQAERG
ncbi:DNA starvation/stationary phase protection protein [Actinotalea sp. M2MS4P-6]|uniref:Dps family protein n=1 Tax=Actinotalea sp. M2MS4P-6 TaxID=2983762 RepID=UPI0021E4D50E|nr:DNA starvation/stationary phase protection protein [Actinotalea sp. M2MS4P-6]MCV2395262.1 DNA starvation/stationary phase protection protein [Actinotalea sp. M2MS4P-6]